MYNFIRSSFLLLEHGVYFLHNVLFRQPLRTLYFEGPSINGFGFWAGLPVEDMCAVVSPGTSALFWADHISQCHVILDRRFVAFLTAIQCLLYFFCFYRVVYWYSIRFFLINPVMRQFDTLLVSRGNNTDTNSILTEKIKLLQSDEEKEFSRQVRFRKDRVGVEHGRG